LQDIDDKLKRRDPDPDDARRWYVNKEGQTMVLIPGPVEFRMGSPRTEEGRYANESPHQRRIGRSFAIAAKPVTVEEFQRFLTDRRLGKSGHSQQHSPSGEGGPIISVSWYRAAQYCNWLSEKEGIPRDQWCYPEVIEEGMTPRRGHLHLQGYRLPTEAEWEYGCRAETCSSRYYGSSLELLPRYAWYLKSTEERTWPVGQKRPNDFGLFDMHGNVFNWCQEMDKDYPVEKDGQGVEDEEDLEVVKNETTRSVRGGAFGYLPAFVRSACRPAFRPNERSSYIGFRPARTWR
jgi:formylglycine-generating enzyme required for sulfatase activity